MISSAWSVWSFSAEVSPVRAFVGAGGPVSESGFRLGRGAAQFRYVPVGGPVVGKLRSDLGSGDGQGVIFSRTLPSLGLSFFGAVLVYWTEFVSMVLFCLVTWSLVSSGMRLFLLVLVVSFVALTLLFPLLLVFRFLVTMFVFCLV